MGFYPALLLAFGITSLSMFILFAVFKLCLKPYKSQFKADMDMYQQDVAVQQLVAEQEMAQVVAKYQRYVN